MFRSRSIPESTFTASGFSDDTIRRSTLIVRPGVTLTRVQQQNAVAGKRRMGRFLNAALRAVLAIGDDVFPLMVAVFGGLIGAIATIIFGVNTLLTTGIGTDTLILAGYTAVAGTFTVGCIRIGIIANEDDISTEALIRARRKLLTAGEATLDTQRVSTPLDNALGKAPFLSPTLRSEVARDLANLRWDYVNVANDRAMIAEELYENRNLEPEDRKHLQARLDDFTQTEIMLRERAERLAGAVSYAATNERLIAATSRLTAAESRQAGEHTEALVNAYTRALTN